MKRFSTNPRLGITVVRFLVIHKKKKTQPLAGDALQNDSNHLRNTHGESQVRHLCDIIVKETGVGDNRIIGQGLDTGAGIER